jgi:VWFA-related protein
MTVPRPVCIFLLLLISSGGYTAFGQTTVPAAPPDADPSIASAARSIRVNVVAETKAGQPVTNLDRQDFTILDNKTARPITSFKIATAADDPPSVILLIDAVNLPFSTVAYARDGINKFLRLNEGQLVDPTTIAVLTDDGVKMEGNFTKDGNTLSDVLEHHNIGLRQITRSAQWGGFDRLQICLNSMQQMITYASSIPGRKIVIWISPGWPLISGPRIQLDGHQEQWIFDQIVQLTTRLRENNITLYNPNPIGVSESMIAANYYEDFLKGVSKPNQVQFGNLGLQVLAVHSGGLAIEGNSDVMGMIQRCLQDARSWYIIGFDPLPADRPNEYHHIDVKIDRPGIVARTRDGYYANPEAVPVR